MKFRGLALLLVLASNAFLLVAACGGSDDAGPADSGAEGAATDAQTGAVEAGCPVSTAVFEQIPEDASIADGATTTGTCISCVKGGCNSAIEACANDCPCITAAAKVLTCVEHNQTSPENCSGSFLTGSAIGSQAQSFGIALLLCINQKCKDECAVNAFNDGGKNDATTDASADAPHD